ncbi:MAG: tetratricopeptide repeat protein [Desulfobacteraceae bacterium]|nr:MAG: tetratricopeptide repeat protein [Desulfobacteraceae bacterium]
MKASHKSLLIALGLIAITIAAYAKIYSFEFINFDDTCYVTKNERVQQGLNSDNVVWAFIPAGGPDQVYWHPLTWLSHMLDVELFGLNPAGHHLMNLAFHIINVLLLFLVLQRMTGEIWKSAFVAALFALHPINVDSVAWIAERKNLFSTTFWMLTMLAYIRYARKPSLARYLLVFFTMALGLLAKPMLVTLPCVLLLMDFWPLGRIDLGQNRLAGLFLKKTETAFPLTSVSRLIAEKIPLLCLSILAIGMSLFSLHLNKQFTDHTSVAMMLRMENAMVSYVLYLWKLIWPSKMAVYHPFPEFIPAWHVMGALLFIGLTSAWILAKSRQSPHLATGWFWFLGTLVPVIGLVQGGLWPAIAERWAYVPGIGMFIIVAWGFPAIIPSHRFKRKTIAFSAGTVLFALFCITRVQSGHWINSQALFSHALQVTSNNYIAHNNLAQAYSQEARLSDAFHHFALALAIKPDHAVIHYNMADCYKKKGDRNKAISHYRQAIAIRPHYGDAYNHLGLLLLEMGRPDEAVTTLQTAIMRDSGYWQAHYSLGNAFQEMGRTKRAIYHYQQAIHMKPNDAKTQNAIGTALTSTGNTDEAIRHYMEAIQINPQFADAHYNLGNAYRNQGQLNQAVLHYQKAIEIEANNEKAHHNMGGVLMTQGRIQEAIKQYQESLKINPDYASAHYNLGIAYFNTGNKTGAIASFKEALRLSPGAAHIQAALDQAMQLP